MRRSILTKSVSLGLLALVGAGCSGVKAIPEGSSQWDPSPKLRGSLTGTETVFDAPNQDTDKADKKSLSSKDIPGSYRDIRAVTPAYLPPLLSSRADTLPSGAVVFWVEDSSLPIASIQFLWNEGSLGLSPQTSEDLRLLGSMLREGGAGQLDPRAVDDTLEELGAELSINFGSLRSQASLQGFTRDIPFLLDLLDTMVHHPRLDTSRLGIVKTEERQDIEHRLDAPAQVLEAAWSQVQYGPSAWTRFSDTAQVSAVTQARLRQALQGRLAAKGAYVAVAGRFDKAQLRQKLSAFFERVPRTAPDSLRVRPALPALHETGVWIAPVEASQAFVRIGTRFVRRDNPDFYPLMLACQVLGSGFGTRLVDRIRSDEGLAYHVGAFAGSDYDREATLGVELQTKSISAQKAIGLVFEEIEKLRRDGFRPGELEKARKGIRAALPTYFDSPEATAGMFLESAAWGRRDDHFRVFQRALDTIPDSVVLSTFRRYFVPGELRVVVAGPKEQMLSNPADGAAPLSRYGKVHELTATEILKSDKN